MKVWSVKGIEQDKKDRRSTVVALRRGNKTGGMEGSNKDEDEGRGGITLSGSPSPNPFHALRNTISSFPWLLWAVSLPLITNMGLSMLILFYAAVPNPMRCIIRQMISSGILIAFSGTLLVRAWEMTEQAKDFALLMNQSIRLKRTGQLFLFLAILEFFVYAVTSTFAKLIEVGKVDISLVGSLQRWACASIFCFIVAISSSLYAIRYVRQELKSYAIWYARQELEGT
jgi:hypothetical protein